MNCFHCGRAIEVKERGGFRDECPQCDRPLHVCRNCGFYEPGLNNDCRETQAERVVEKDRANFCEYFIPSGAARAQAPGANAARTNLEALFKKK
ncbi:MAG TPA: hypothetical protein VMA09_22770 [Candidatus Binataceae bacterium]|nr:hypothetical protein [Candidatus Binataceae bacterium]